MPASSFDEYQTPLVSRYTSKAHESYPAVLGYR